jgi:hypothetical protein
MRCLNVKWWAFPDPRQRLQGGPAIDVFDIGGGRFRVSDSSS